MARLLITFALFFLSGPVFAQALQNILITDDSFIGKSPGPDGLWGTGDDFDAPARNSFGGASEFSFSDGSYGYWQGTLVSETDPMTGQFSFLDMDWTGEVDCILCGGPSAISGALAPGMWGGAITSGTGFIAQSEVAVTSFLGTETIRAETQGYPNDNGSSLFLFNGADPAAVFPGNQDLIDHFNILIDIVDATGDDWVFISTDRQDLEILDGVRATLTGTQSWSGYQLAPIPVPAALPMLAGALLILGRIARKS